MQAIGCVGAISNGPSRDIDEIRPMKFQYLLSGVTAGHGAQAIHGGQCGRSPVAGMDVALPARSSTWTKTARVKFPADKLSAVLENVRALQKHEAERMAQMRQATSAAELRAIFGGPLVTATMKRNRER